MGDGKRDVDGRGLDSIARGEDGPVSDSAEDELKAEQDFEIAGGAAQVFDRTKTATDEDGPKDHTRDDDGANDVRNDAKGVVAKSRAEDDLQQDQDGSPNSEIGRAHV